MPQRREDVHSWVREARLQAGLSQQGLADLAGVSRRTVQFVEYGTYAPTVGVALRLARVLDARVENLFTLAEPDLSVEGHDATK